MSKKIAISDIHGNAQTFRALVLQLKLQKGDALFLLGDFIDRGPNSKTVLDFIFRLQNNGIVVNCLKGNHEELILDAMVNDKIKLHWLYYCGGVETLSSFGVQEPQEIGDKYIDFLEKLPYYLRVDNYFLVHAGLDFSHQSGNPLFQTQQMLWIRKWYHQIDYNWLGEEIIVHGHTPVEQLEIETMKDYIYTKRYINIDNGCFKLDTPNMGQLCAFNLNTHELIYQKNIDVV